MKHFFVILTLLIGLTGSDTVWADWPMAAHDPRRSSWAEEDGDIAVSQLRWLTKIEPYIPSASHIITVQGAIETEDLVYVTTSEGIYALDSLEGDVVWIYQTDMPVGQSPTVVDSVLYLSCYDKTIHAIDAKQGTKIWQSLEAGAGFDVSPLVVNNQVLVGSRDGFFYCLNAQDGTLKWVFETDGPISYSAAYQTYPEFPDGVVFFASTDDHAYALSAADGSLVWKSPDQFVCDGLATFWPVVAENKVLYSASIMYPPESNLKIITYQLDFLYSLDEIGNYVDEQGRLDLQKMKTHATSKPGLRSLLVLDRVNGQQAEVAPILWWGNPVGNRYPPALGPGGKVYISAPWENSNVFGRGRILAWEMGTNLATPIPALDGAGLESADEPSALAIVGNEMIYFNDGGDGVDKGAAFRLTGGTSRVGWNIDTFKAYDASWNDSWDERRYGNTLVLSDSTWQNRTGHHGYQNPPVPLRNRIYFHRSNAVICME